MGLSSLTLLYIFFLQSFRPVSGNCFPFRFTLGTDDPAGGIGGGLLTSYRHTHVKDCVTMRIIVHIHLRLEKFMSRISQASYHMDQQEFCPIM